MKPNSAKWLRFTVKLGLLALAGIAWWLTELRQSDFGEAYAHELQKLHSELDLETVNFSDDRAYAIFDVSVEAHPDAKTNEYLVSLASDVKKVYCAQIAKSKHDLKIKLFHVNIRAESGDESNIIFSHALSNSICA